MSRTKDPLLVYIVDDDASVRGSLVRLIRSAGLDPLAFESPEQFLAEVKGDRKACVLLDITMPRMTGTQVQARLRQMQIDLPVIAVSARDDDDTRELARVLGARMFMRKPVDDQALLDAIEWVTNAQHP